MTQMLHLSLLICILITKIVSIEKVYKVELKDLNKHKRILTICIGSPQQCLPFKVSNELSVSCVSNALFYPNGFKWENSNTFSIVEKNKSLMYKNQELKGSYIKDYIQIDTTPILLKDLEFFMVDSGLLMEGIAGILGLGVIDKISHRTFLQLAYESNLIENHAVHLSLRSIRPFIQFGLPLTTIEEIANPEQYDTRPQICYFASSEEKYLNCDLGSMIYYSEKSKEPPIILPGNIPFFFNNEINGILCPYYFFRLLTENIFKPQMDRKECKIAQKDNTDVIICNHDLSEDIIGDFFFVMGKWSIKYSIKELFISEKEGLVFQITNKDQGKNYWMLGRSLFDKYDMILDYQMNLVYFR